MSATALNRPNVLARLVSLLALAAAVVVVIVLAGGSSSYVLKLKMANASGLKPGSQIFIGGVPVGTVGDITMNRAGDAVIATLNIEQGRAHVGRGVTAHVIATNLLGTKSVQINPGDRSAPLPSGTILPEAATSIPTDLDQVVDVLNQPTRVDLQLMLREAGVAVAGRKGDVSAILRQFPLSLQAATKLLQGLVTDNHSLADFIANSDQFIARVNAQGPKLQRLIAAAGGASRTFADRAQSLAATIQGAPEFLNRVKAYFAAITVAFNHLNPLTPALAQAAVPLDETLKAIRPFADAAVPTLNRAAQVAPSLSALAEQATPTLQQAEPAVSALSNLSRLSQPLSAWLGLSAPDLLGIFDSWSHAIQYRDGVSHIFNGDLYINPEIVLNVANQGATPAQKAQNLLDLAPALVKQLGLDGAVAKARQLLAGLAAHHQASGSGRPPAKTPAATAPARPAPSGAVGGAPTTPASGGGSGLSGLGSGLKSLLGGVLGTVTGHGQSGSGSGAPAGTGATGGSGSGGAVGQALKGLVGYLLGK